MTTVFTTKASVGIYSPTSQTPGQSHTSDHTLVWAGVVRGCASRAEKVLEPYMDGWRAAIRDLAPLDSFGVLNHPSLRVPIPVIFYGVEKGRPDLRRASLPSGGADARAKRVLARMKEVAGQAPGVRPDADCSRASVAARSCWLGWGFMNS